jgi:hypothetical protein
MSVNLHVAGITYKTMQEYRGRLQTSISNLETMLTLPSFQYQPIAAATPAAATPTQTASLKATLSLYKQAHLQLVDKVISSAARRDAIVYYSQVLTTN